MSAKLSLSIAMAIYNGERFLRQQLDSLSRQTFLPTELVVTDDASTDSTVEILRDFSASAPFPVKFYRNDDRLGFADNFLKAACLCNGALIAFCDGDDVWRQDKLEICLREFESSNFSLVTHMCAQVDEELRFLGYIPGIKRSFTIRRGCSDRRLPWNGGATLVLREEVVREMSARWPKSHLPLARRTGRSVIGHDQVAFFVANALGDIRYLADPLIQYRRHDQNTTTPLSALKMKADFAMGVGNKAYRRQSMHYSMQARLLKEIASATGAPAVSTILSQKAAQMSKSAFAARLRSRIYSDPNKLRRLFWVLKASYRGVYHSTFGTAGAQSIAKDLTIGVLRTAEKEIS